ncbi:LysR family transcriptional regulator [Litoreibacter albidus]|uniref:Transcriptional regulator, LysR family n=1 Tax=Litoreibacter albidus TaxID=670155 RepID=A0A1H2W3H7_9RHOB|nr:LysR family transcriptional regulator [Litoreibacter albidus]SDW75077.1 transcriptional regulator, LysR family [Litoreibacter albidus]
MDRIDRLDWTLIQTFLAVAAEGSLSGAARALGVSQPTLGRQVRAMEEQLGITLFYRQSKGLRLSAEGEALMPYATAMSNAASGLATIAAGHDNSLQGTVRITASEFTAMYSLPPILARLRSDHPDIQIELNATDLSENLLFREADIAVRMYRPTQLEVVTKKLGVLKLGFFAAKSYLDQRCAPSSVDELMQHDLLGYDRSERFIRAAAKMGWQLSRDDFAFRCDSQQVHCEMIRMGAGIGVMACALGAKLPDVEPVLPDFPVPGLELWLTTHEAVRHTPRVAAVWKVLEDGLRPELSQDSTIPIMHSP